MVRVKAKDIVRVKAKDIRDLAKDMVRGLG